MSAELPSSKEWQARFRATLPIRRQGIVHSYSCLDVARDERQVALVAAPEAPPARALAMLDTIERLHGCLDHPLVPRLVERRRIGEQDVVLLDCEAVTDLDTIIAGWAEAAPPRLPYDAAIGFSETLLDVLEHAHEQRDAATGGPICMGGMRWSDVLVSSDGSWWFVFGRNHVREGGVHYAPEVAGGGPPSPGADLYAMQLMLRTVIPYVELPEDMLQAFREEASEASNEWFRWIETRLLAGKPELRPQSVAEMRPQNEAHWRRMGVRPDPTALRAYFARPARDRLREPRAVSPSSAGPSAPAVGPGELTVSEDGRWFVTTDGTQVDISRRGALRRIVAALAARRVEQPGTALDVDSLVAVGWPNQKLVPYSATNRLYVAMSTLRGMGLAVQHRDDGYLLPPSLELKVHKK